MSRKAAQYFQTPRGTTFFCAWEHIEGQMPLLLNPVLSHRFQNKCHFSNVSFHEDTRPFPRDNEPKRSLNTPTLPADPCLAGGEAEPAQTGAMVHDATPPVTHPRAPRPHSIGGACPSSWACPALHNELPVYSCVRSCVLSPVGPSRHKRGPWDHPKVDLTTRVPPTRVPPTNPLYTSRVPPTRVTPYQGDHLIVCIESYGLL